jgi:hypothetical protein
MTKLTKKDMFTAIKKVMETGSTDVDPAVLAEFCDKEIAALEAKSEKAKERAVKKAAEGDALRDKVEGVLTENFQTIAEVTEVVAEGDEDITVHKVAYRLNALVKANKAQKKEVTVGGEGKTRKVMAYALPGAVEE